MKKLLIALYVAVLVVMAAATFVENAMTTAFAHRWCYGAWWFTALWAALALVGAAYMIRSNERRVSVVLLHASFLVILLGALLTHLTGLGGTIHLRMNEPQDIAEIEHNGSRHFQRLDFSVELTDLQIIEDGEGNVIDYRSEFIIIPVTSPDGDFAGNTAPGAGQSGSDSKREVRMNKIATYGCVRFYQMAYDYDLRGATLIINRDPYGIPVTYGGYLLLFASFISLCLKKTGSLRMWLSCIALTVAWCVYYFILDGSWSQIPVLRHPLLFVHVIVIIMAYALLLLQAIRSSVWLIRNRKERNLPIASRKEGRGVRLCLCLLSIGIFLGAIWANISWGNYWSWDPKEVWALITLMVYAVPVHSSSLKSFQNPRVFHAYMLAAFLAVLMTYFGVSYMLTGMHSYVS